MFLCIVVGIGFCTNGFAQQGSSTANSAGASSTTQRFITSATYGIILGSVVGLGYTAAKSKEKRHIAVGASVGLYAGILWAAWRTYDSGPKKEEKKAVPAPTPQNTPKQDPSYDPSDPLGLGPKGAFYQPNSIPLVSFDNKSVVLGYSLAF